MEGLSEGSRPEENGHRPDDYDLGAELDLAEGEVEQYPEVDG